MLRRICLLSLCWLFLVSTAYANEIGYVTEATDGARLIRGDSVYVLDQGLALNPADVIRTDNEGHAQLEMNDGSLLEIGPSSQIHLSEYLLDNQHHIEKAEVSLLTGWLRFLTAKLSAAGSYQYTTPTLTIGIRGTEGTIYAEEGNSSLSLTEGMVELAELDEQGQVHVSGRLEAGEYVARNQGQSLWRSKTIPDSFRLNIPPRLKKQRIKKLRLLKKRGIKPKLLRKARFEDIKKIMRANPKIRSRMIKQFKQRFTDPAFKANFRKFMQSNPGLRERIKNDPVLKHKLKALQKQKRYQQQQMEKRNKQMQRQQNLKNKQR